MIQGFPFQSSLFPGDTLRLHVSTDAPAFRVDIYRQGTSLVTAEYPFLLPVYPVALSVPELSVATRKEHQRSGSEPPDRGTVEEILTELIVHECFPDHRYAAPSKWKSPSASE